MTDIKQLYDDLLPLLKDPRMKHDGRAESWCPCHADGKKHGRRSLSLHPKYGLTCWAGCAFKDILDALGYRGPIREPLPVEREEGPQKIYLYATSQGDIVAEKGRWEKEDGSKTFLLRRPDGDWAKGLAPMKVADLPLYNAPMIAKSNGNTPIYFVEGEKAADACIARGLNATTLAGGAGSKDFGDALQLLRGHTVILWPDNDPPGREHMVRVHAQLRDIAARVSFLSCPRPLPTKGDAYDYFALGGTAQELQQGAITEPVVEYLAADAIRVLHPTVGVTFEFTFEGMTYGKSALESELTVLLQGQRVDDGFFQRINILSSSQRTELRRDLDQIYGKDYDWTRVLNTVLSLVRKRYNDLDRSVDTVDIEAVTENAFLVQPLLVADAPNIIFGDGGSFKSYLAHSIAISVATGQRFVGYSVRRARVLVVDYEDNQSNFKRRINRLSKGLACEIPKGGISYWQAHGIPFSDQAHALKQKVEKDGIGLVIVDSAGPACGGRPEDAETALAYFRALSSLNTTTLSLCHIPKGGDTEKPLGSAYWHNEARRTWLVQRVQEDDSDEIDIGLVCKKVNDGRRPSPLSFHIAFDGEEGAVRITSQAYSNVVDLAQKLPLGKRVALVLTQPMTAQEIADDLADPKVQAINIIKVLTEGRKKSVFTVVGERTGKTGRPALVWAKAETHRTEPPF